MTTLALLDKLQRRQTFLGAAKIAPVIPPSRPTVVFV